MVLLDSKCYDYYSMGRLISVRGIGLNKLTVTYQPTCIENAMGHQICYEYDIIGRRTSIKTEQGTVEILYNKQNYPICVKDGNGNEYCRTYDKMGNLTAMTPPNQGTEGTCWIYYFVLPMMH